MGTVSRRAVMGAGALAVAAEPFVAVGPATAVGAGLYSRARFAAQTGRTFRLGGRTVRLDEVSEVRPGQRFAFVIDTRLCDNVFALAEGVDLLVIEATFAAGEADLAWRYGHLTADQAGRSIYQLLVVA